MNYNNIMTVKMYNLTKKLILGTIRQYLLGML